MLRYEHSLDYPDGTNIILIRQRQEGQGREEEVTMDAKVGGICGLEPRDAGGL